MLHLPSAVLNALHRALAEDRAPAEAAAVARRVGFETGEGFYLALQAWLESASGADVSQTPADTFWERFGEFFSQLGWGRLEFEPLHAGVVSLSSAEWAEATAESPSGQPACHFTTGMLADLLGRIADGDVAVMEVECRSRGDERCRFLLGGAEALERVYDGVREGRPFQKAIEQLG